jgi:hypothetical protein
MMDCQVLDILGFYAVAPCYNATQVLGRELCLGYDPTWIMKKICFGLVEPEWSLAVLFSPVQPNIWKSLSEGACPERGMQVAPVFALTGKNCDIV